MTSSPITLLSLLSICLALSIFPSIEASVPKNATFQYVNTGNFGEYVVEYNANYQTLDIFSSVFILCFYNSTPDAFTLALRMGYSDSIEFGPILRWVWEANRGNPVRLNATLTFGRDGNLVLADSDGRIAWQTNTANKGVTGLKLLDNGNMVLHDAKGKFIWQSFDSPTDTLLSGQSLRLVAGTKLVSRASVTENKNGPYSLVMEPETLSMYYKPPNSATPLRYFSFADIYTADHDRLERVAFGPNYTLTFYVTGDVYSGLRTFERARYNATFTYLRLGMDGNLRFFTYQENVRRSAWQETFTFFARNSRESECQLPERCGSFGLCEDNQCVACPSPSGLLGWSRNCKTKKVNSCKASDIRYYQLTGVDHYASKYTQGDGPMRRSLCMDRCTKDCKCLGYFYNTNTSRCLIAQDLHTLTRVGNSSHLAFIKAPLK